MEERSPPVAVRVIRPYADEDALLEAEVSAFSRTGIVLVGAPSRPNGVVLRFEMCLRDGTAVMRGEGRVVGYRAPTAQEEGALMLRFTRLDVKSKALLDRAVALREERRSLAPPPPAPAAVQPPAGPQASAPPPRPAPSAAPPAPSVPPTSARPSGSIAPRMALPSVAPVAAEVAPAVEPATSETSPETSLEPSLETSLEAAVETRSADEEAASPVAVALPAPAAPSTTEDLTDEDVEEIDPEEIHAEDEGGLTEQAPPVAMVAALASQEPDPVLDASTQELPAAEVDAIEAVASPATPDVAEAVAVSEPAPAVVVAEPESEPVVAPRTEPMVAGGAAAVVATRPRPEALAALARRTFSPSLDDTARRDALERLRARRSARTPGAQ